MLDRGHGVYDAHPTFAPVDLGEGHRTTETQPGHALADSYLLICADAVDDLQRIRIATANRLDALTRPREKHGKGYAGTPEAKRLAELAKTLVRIEARATSELTRAMRAHPLGPFVDRTIGLGEVGMARLLAAIGDPAARANPAKLWAYCGHGDPAKARLCAANITYELDDEGRERAVLPFSPVAKMRTRIVALGAQCLTGEPDKNGNPRPRSPYRDVYDRECAKWADRDTSGLHKRNHALRVVGKAILLDLWREAKRLEGAHAGCDTHRVHGPRDASSAAT